MVIEPNDLHLRLVFSPCLCAYLKPLESPQEEEMATRSVDTDTVVLSRLPIRWILHISSCCAELVTFSAREERTDLLPAKSGGLGNDLEWYVDLSRGRDRTTGPASATSSDQLARVT